MTLDYEELVQKARQANDSERRQLLDGLVQQFAAAALHWAYLILEDENAAYDAVQDAWLSAFLHLDELRENAAFPSWFRQIVISSSLRTIRREKDSDPLTDHASTSADPTEEVERRERVKRIREAVEALPDAERIVTELFYFADYPQQEIAEVLSIPLTTVKKRLQYARERLKGTIQPEVFAQLEVLYESDSSTNDNEIDPSAQNPPIHEWLAPWNKSNTADAGIAHRLPGMRFYWGSR